MNVGSIDEPARLDEVSVIAKPGFFEKSNEVKRDYKQRAAEVTTPAPAKKQRLRLTYGPPVAQANVVSSRPRRMTTRPDYKSTYPREILQLIGATRRRPTTRPRRRHLHRTRVSGEYYGLCY